MTAKKEEVTTNSEGVALPILTMLAVIIIISFVSIIGYKAFVNMGTTNKEISSTKSVEKQEPIQENKVEDPPKHKVFKWIAYSRKEWKYDIWYFPNGFNKCDFRMEEFEYSNPELIGFKNGKKVYNEAKTIMYIVPDYLDIVIAKCGDKYFGNDGGEMKPITYQE